MCELWARRFLSIPVLCLFWGCAGVDTEPGIVESSLAVITRDGNVIGTQRNFAREVDDGFEFTSQQTLRVVADGSRPLTLVESRTRIEDRDQNVVGLVRHTRFGRYERTTRAEILGDTAVIRREAPSGRREITMSLPDGIRFDNGAGLIAEWKFDENPVLEFQALDIRAPHVERIAYTFVAADTVETSRILRRTTYVDGGLRSVSWLTLDEVGALLNTEQAVFGVPVRTDTAASPVVRRAYSSNPVRDSLVRSPYRISRQAMRGHIRYRFRLTDDIAFRPPETSEQRVTVNPDGIVVDICTDCGPGMDTSEEVLSNALQPTFWLQADHPRLARIGETVRNSDGTDLEKMARLERWARQRMEDIDFAGHYSAAEALARGAGDCTEGAVVLAALGRAAGIPTRVASGIVYSRERYHGVSHAFMPHAWTLAYVDGEWKSFDMSLDGFDATHIALTISDGDPGSILSGHQLAGLLKWEAMTEVRRRPSDAGR